MEGWDPWRQSVGAQSWSPAPRSSLVPAPGTRRMRLCGGHEPRKRQLLQQEKELDVHWHVGMLGVDKWRLAGEHHP